MEKLQPSLRFPEFKENWEYKILGNVAKFSKGKGLSKIDIIENGANECIRYGELYTLYNETIKIIKSKTDLSLKECVLSEFNDIIIPASGETQIDIATASCVLKDGVILGGDLNIIKTEQDGVFLSYYLNNKKKKDIANLAQGISVVHLYSSQLSLLKINLPTLPEQQKIASFLTAVDEKLSLLIEKKNKLEQYKKGVMQKIFSQELRFKDENGKEYAEWEEKRFNEVFVTVSTKKYQIKSSEILNSGSFKVVDQGKNLIAGYSDKSINLFTKLPVIIFGDHTTILKYIDFEFVIGADGTKILTNNDVKNNLKYLFYFLQFNNVEQEGYKRHFSILSNKLILLPSKEEQTKIANFLTAIDQKIEVVNQQIKNTEEYKKGCYKECFVSKPYSK